MGQDVKERLIGGGGGGGGLTIRLGEIRKQSDKNFYSLKPKYDKKRVTNSSGQ